MEGAWAGVPGLVSALEGLTPEKSVCGDMSLGPMRSFILLMTYKEGSFAKHWEENIE